MSAFTQSGRSELCKNVRDLDVNGTVRHFNLASIRASGLVPTLIRR